MAVPLGATDVVPGETATLKSGATTLSEALAECVSDPLVPVMVKLELLAELLGVVVTVRVLVTGPLIDPGEKEGVAPAGKPVAAKFTVPVNPFRGVMLTV